LRTHLPLFPLKFFTDLDPFFKESNILREEFSIVQLDILEQLIEQKPMVEKEYPDIKKLIE
tara:strand:- start:258 stop:440 length:183 start_codon:yes stop_codon:yes gene_type:complete